MSDKIIVTIARQYGSGGHAVGQIVAENFNMAYHDKSLIEKEIETTVDEISSLPDDNVRSALEKVFQFTTASVRQVVNITGLPFRLVYSALKATATAPVKMTKKLLRRKDKKQETVQQATQRLVYKIPNGFALFYFF